MDPYVGEIRLVAFNFAPNGWEFCEGQLLPISEYEVLFQLLGTTYGGDGQTTFALPDLRGRAAVHMGNNSQGSYALGEKLGSETETLTVGQIPSHSHLVQASGQLGTTTTPNNNLLAQAPLGLGNTYAASANVMTMSSQSISLTGGGEPHNNMMPFLTLNYVISLFGIFPSQN